MAQEEGGRGLTREAAELHVMDEAEQEHAVHAITDTDERETGESRERSSNDEDSQKTKEGVKYSETSEENAINNEESPSKVEFKKIENSDNESFDLSEAELEELALALEEDKFSRVQKEAVEPAKSSASSGIWASIQSMNPDMAFILDVALAYFSKKKNYQTGGHDPTKTGFNFQQLELSVSASVDPFFRFDANLVFSLFGVEIEEAYATTLSLPWSLQVRAGQFLSRFGRLNSTHPHSWSFVDQPFAIGKFFGSEGNRGLGAELSWLTPLPWYVELVASIQMANGGATNRSYFGNDRAEISGLGDFLYTLSAKQFFPLSQSVGLNWGLSAQFGPNATGHKNRTDIYGTDIYLKANFDSNNASFLAFQAEELLRLRQVPNDLLIDHAGYAQILYQFNREWSTAVRGEWGSGLPADPLDPDWTKYRGRVAAQATYNPSHFARLRAQINVDIPRWQNTPIIATFLNLEVLVGTHPAHNY